MFFLTRQSAQSELASASIARSLADVAPGVSCIIRKIDAAPDKIDTIMRIGLIPGVEVTVMQTGDPSRIKFMGCQFAVRTELLRAIQIDPADSAPDANGDTV